MNTHYGGTATVLLDEARRNKSTGILGSLIIGLVILSQTNNMASLGSGKYIGVLAILCLSLICYNAMIFYVAKTRTYPKPLAWIIAWGFAFICANGLGFFLKHDDKYFVTIYQFVMLMMFFLTCAMMSWNEGRIKLMSRLSGLLIIANAGLLIMQDGRHSFSGFFLNPNTLGAVAFFLLFFLFLRKFEGGTKTKLCSMLVLISAVLIYYSSARSVFIALLFTALTYMFWGLIARNKVIYATYFIGVIGGVIGLIFVYPRMIYWPSFYYINNLMWEYTGKYLLSGREDIWLLLLDVIDYRLWLGYGAGTLPSEILNQHLSAHNLYLQITLQTGVIGLSSFLILLFSIWNFLWHGRMDKRVRLSAAFFIGILIHQSFEVMLTQNNLAIGLLQWLIISIGVSFSYRQLEKKKIAAQGAVIDYF